MDLISIFETLFLCFILFGISVHAIVSPAFPESSDVHDVIVKNCPAINSSQIQYLSQSADYVHVMFVEEKCVNRSFIMKTDFNICNKQKPRDMRLLFERNECCKSFQMHIHYLMFFRSAEEKSNAHLSSASGFMKLNDRGFNHSHIENIVAPYFRDCSKAALRVSSYYFNFQNGTYEVLPNTSVNLTCDNYNIEYSEGTYRYQFFQPEAQLTGKITSNKFEVDGITPPGGNYSCAVYHEERQLSEASVEIRVVDTSAPYIRMKLLNESGNITAKEWTWIFQVRAWPWPKFEVLKLPGNVSTENSEFKLVENKEIGHVQVQFNERIRLTANDIGFYILQATSASGLVTANETIDFILKYNVAPENIFIELDSMCLLQKYEKTIKLSKCQMITVSCSSQAEPPPEVNLFMTHCPRYDRCSYPVQIVHEVVNESYSYPEVTVTWKILLNQTTKVQCRATNNQTDKEALSDEWIILVNENKINYADGTVTALIVVTLFILTGIVVKVFHWKVRRMQQLMEAQKQWEKGNIENLNEALPLHAQTSLLPYNTKWEVAKKDISFEKLLGQGAFGSVFKAKARNVIMGESSTTVAVKTTRNQLDKAQFAALQSELKILLYIGRHPNIVNLMGACAQKSHIDGELLMVVEYCENGSILEYLTKHKKAFSRQLSMTKYSFTSPNRGHQNSGFCRFSYNSRSNFSQKSVISNSSYLPMESSQPLLVNNSYRLEYPANYLDSVVTNVTYVSGGDSDEPSENQDEIKQEIRVRDLLNWSYQIACGMEYLASKRVLHGDLAARNVLLTGTLLAKISDFGLAKDIYKTQVYKTKNGVPLPMRWLAIEVLEQGNFSTASDVWAYGVTIWEIFSLGMIPYPGIPLDENFLQKLKDGLRLRCPEHAAIEIYELMLKCWAADPEARKTFSEIKEELDGLLPASSLMESSSSVSPMYTQHESYAPCEYVKMHSTSSKSESDVYQNQKQSINMKNVL